MGEIKSKGIKSAIFSYLGLGLGAVNILFIFPKVLSTEEIGLYRLLISISTIALSFASLAMGQISNKFFTYFKSNLKIDENDFLGKTIIFYILGLVISCIIFFIAKQEITKFYQNNSPLFNNYYYLVFPSFISLTIFSVFENYSLVNLKTESVYFSKELLYRLLITILLLLIAFKIINFDFFIIINSYLYFVLSIPIIFTLKRSGLLIINFKSSIVYNKFKGKIIKFWSYVYGGQIISTIGQHIDSIFISGLIGLSSTGIFVVSEYISTLVLVPSRILISILTPKFAELWRLKKNHELQDLFQKGTLAQFTIGSVILGLICLNLDTVFYFLGKDFEEGLGLLIVLLIARQIDLFFGLNSELLGTSNAWKFNFISYISLIILLIPLNYFLINRFGLIGSGFSSLFAYLFFNVSRTIFIKRKFNITFYSKKLGISFILTSLTLFVLMIIKYELLNFESIQSIIVRNFSLSIVFLLILLIYFYKNQTFPAINEKMNKYLK